MGVSRINREIDKMVKHAAKNMAEGKAPAAWFTLAIAGIFALAGISDSIASLQRRQNERRNDEAERS